MKFYSVFLLAICMGLSNTVVASVIVGDGANTRIWRQVSQTTNISYDQLDTIYDINTGELDTGESMIGDVDFAGWTWASAEDVNQLFGVFLGLAGFPTDDLENYILSEMDSAWAPEIIDIDGAGPDEGVFEMTGDEFLSTDGFVIGYTRTLGEDGFSPLMAGIIDVEPGGNDFARFQAVPSDVQSPRGGVWLYTNYVPAPPAFILLLVSVGLLLGIKGTRGCQLVKRI